MIGRLLVAAFASAAVATISFAASPPAGGTATARPIEIDRNSVLILIRTTLVALHQANQTGNYSVLYGISAPGFQQANSPEKLAQIFASLRAKSFDLSAVTVLDPQLSLLPVLYPNGVMRMAGFFPSVPLQVDFDLQFIGVQGQWRLLGISVNVVPATSLAPSVEAPRPSPTASVAPSSESPPPTTMESSTPVAPSVDVGKPKPKPTEAKPKSMLASPRP